jgi:glycosyltransferase involved in cell wall biosynthesis
MNPPQHSTIRFSLIIPAHNEEAYLSDLLFSAEKARNRYVGGQDEIEMIVVDNASADSTADPARAMGCRVIQEDKGIIAVVRNAGAKSAVGQIFFIVGNRFNPL